jgi:alginate export protein/uncharacterized protein DUF5666
MLSDRVRFILLGPAILSAFSPALAESSPGKVSGLAPQLVVGAEVQVKGKLRPDGSFLADQIDLNLDGDRSEELRGIIESVDAENQRLRILGFTVQVSSDTRLSREPALPVTFGDLVPGLRVKVEGLHFSGRTFLAKKIRIRQDLYPEQKIVGPVESIARSGVGLAVLQVLGRPVVVNATTDLVAGNGPSRPALPVGLTAGDEDDLLVTERNQIGDHLAVLGELRFRLEKFSNLDLDASNVDGEEVPAQFGIVGFLTEFDTFLAYAEVLGEHEHSFPEDPGSNDEQEVGSARGGQAYVRLAHFPGPGLSLVVGRQKYYEARRWYYDNRNLDAVRLFGEYGRVAFQVSVSRDLFDETRNQRDQDATNRIAEVRWDLGSDVALQAFYLSREDRTQLSNSPEILGLRLIGDPGHHLEFWADLAHERGTRGKLDPTTGAILVRDIRAHALDSGLTYRPRIALDPSFTASFALGSGDDQLALPGGQQPRGTDGTFRQSGLQRNRGSLNGVVSFHYYGELLDPELTNLRIQTLGAGLRPARPLSLDLLFHRYRQDVPAPRLENAELDADPSGLDPHLGSEWDLVVGYEPSKDFELRLTGGCFQPGRAFPADATRSTIATVQARFRF